MTSFETRNSMFNISDKSKSFAITTPSHWNSKTARKTFDELLKLKGLRSQDDNELHVEEVRKKGFFYLTSTLCPIFILLKLNYLKS